MATKTIYSVEYRRLVEQLRTRREALNLSQGELAKKLGWRQQRLSAIEIGARRIVVLEFLRLAAALGLAPDRAIRLAMKATRTRGSVAR